MSKIVRGNFCDFQTSKSKRTAKNTVKNCIKNSASKINHLESSHKYQMNCNSHLYLQNDILLFLLVNLFV